MKRMVALGMLCAAAVTLALPLPSHAGFRSAFAAGVPVATFGAPGFIGFSRSVGFVRSSVVPLAPFGFSRHRRFVREVFFVPGTIIVVPAREVFVVAPPVFAAPSQVLFVSSRCFVDQFRVLRCLP
jgi:hypothetical protein